MRAPIPATVLDAWQAVLALPPLEMHADLRHPAKPIYA